MNFDKTKAFLRRTSLGLKTEKMIRKTGIVHWMHSRSMNNKRDVLGSGTSEFDLFYEEHKVQFQEVEKILEDDMSLKTYQAVIEYRKTFDMEIIDSVIVQPQYFLAELLPPMEDYEGFIDGGACYGDTAINFLKYCTAKDYRMYLWECDIENIRLIKQYLKGTHFEIEPYAMWNMKGKISFEAQGATGVSHISDACDNWIDADSIDNVHSDDRITFIKMDIEGAEMNALKGAVKTIKEQRPHLAICIYHSWRDLFEIPLFIKSLVPEYRCYVRHHADLFAETVLYATL